MAKRKLVSQRNMDKLEREVGQTSVNTGMYHTKLSVAIGKHTYYLHNAIKQGCSLEKEREIIKQLKAFTKQHYVSVHSGRNGTHIHVKDNSVESNKLKKENDELKKQIKDLQENQQRVNTANEVTIQNLRNKMDETNSVVMENIRLKRDFKEITEKNLHLRSENKQLSKFAKVSPNDYTNLEFVIDKLSNDVEELTQENDILRGDLEVEKHNNTTWKKFNSGINERVDNMTKEINQLRESCQQKEMELVGLRGLLSEPKEKIILDKKVFGFNVVISKGEN